MTPEVWVDALAPISLDELVAEADLQVRVDRKYLVPTTDLAGLVARLPDSTRVLQIDGNRCFAYRSVYLDTPDLRCFHHAGRGRRMRFKVRGRRYLDTGATWLEVKTRAARGTTLKTRVPHPDVERAPVGPDGRAFIGATLDRHGLVAGDVSVLTPALVTTYRRTTVHLAAGPGEPGRPASRGTIDTALAFGPPGTVQPTVLVTGLAVVETKGGAAPSALDRQLWRMGHRPVAMSKYGTGLAVLRDDLPDLKWHRTLRRRLRPALHLSDPHPHSHDHKDPS